MKKYHLLSALAMGTFLAGCTSDELIDKSQLGNAMNSDGRISFVKKNTNMTRATTYQRAEEAGHYEFGVYGFKTDATNKWDDEGDIMKDYLVAYGDNQTGNVKNYKQLAANASTYGEDAKEGIPTVTPDGISTWFYENLGSPVGSHKQQTSPAAEIVPAASLQALKYWDKSKDFHNYFAYMPYYGAQNATQSVDVTDAGEESSVWQGVNMKFTGAGIFYTDPADVNGAAQVAANTVWAGTYNASTNRAPYNTEIINANEVNYAAKSVAKANYEKDVPFKFLHANAKIKVAIWEAIPGYKVELINLINDKVVAANPAITAEYKDCAFTPATKTQAIEHNNKPERTDNGTNAATDAVVDPANSKALPSYIKAGNITALKVKDGGTGTARSDMSYEASSITKSTDNLRFTIASDDAQVYPFRSADHNIISEFGQASATVLNTTYYALPNVTSGKTYITSLDADPCYTTKKVTEETGYTFHVSYRLLPEDGSAPTEVYDARVWVAPEFCKWEDGKQYTYIFKITTSSNGVTDPKATAGNIFDPSGETNPYIDPTDPRVPDNPALVPIVFDGIEVADYEAVSTGHGTGDDADTWQISNVESWLSLNGTFDAGGAAAAYKYRFCNYLTTADVYSGAIDLSNEYYQTVTTAPTTAHATYDNVGFVGGDDNVATKDYYFTYGNAEFNAVTSATKSYTYAELTPGSNPAIWGAITNFSNSDNILDKAKEIYRDNFAPLKVATYKMYIWGADDASAAWEYTATPNVKDITITPTLKKEVVEQTMNNKAYKTVSTYTSAGSPIVKYYKATGPTTWSEISEAAFTAVTPAIAKSNIKTEYWGTENEYKKTTTCKEDGTPEDTPTYTWQHWNGSAWVDEAESVFNTAISSLSLNKTIPADVKTNTYTIAYTYGVDRNGYTVTMKTADGVSPNPDVPSQAYGIVVKK